MTGRSTNSAKVVFAVCFLILMAALGGSAVFACFRRLAEKTPKFVNRDDLLRHHSFRELYPFDNTAGDDLFETPKQQNFLEKFSMICNSHQWKRVIETYSAIHNPLTRPFYRLVTSLDKTTGSSIIENGNMLIIRLPNGHLTSTFSDTTRHESWEKVRNFSIWLKKRNIPLLQLLPATKMDDSITVFPPGVPHDYFRMIEQYKSFLAENHIPYLDAKEILLAENGDFYSWFYKTDHHWNVFAGRLTAEITARKLNDEFKVATNTDAVKIENFTLARYSAVFPGSMAKKAGALPEDFDVFYPRKEGLFHLKIPSKGINRTGGFSQTLIVSRHPQSHHAYGCFLYGDQPIIQVENLGCINSSRILVIKHSQANVLCPYLSCAVRYLDMIDPRHFDGSIRSFIEKTKPDAVLICI